MKASPLASPSSTSTADFRPTLHVGGERQNRSEHSPNPQSNDVLYTFFEYELKPRECRMAGAGRWFLFFGRWSCDGFWYAGWQW